VSIRATLKADGPFISLAFEVRAPEGEGQCEPVPPQAYGPLRLATVDDAVVLLSQFARQMGPDKRDRDELP
jgi:hypothetical protein